MCAGNEHDLAAGPGWRDTKRVPLALNDERGHAHGVKLGEPGLLRPAGRMEREREADHRRRAELSGGSAGHARAGGAPADDEWRVECELLDHGHPGGVQLSRRGRRAPARDAVRLLNQDDGQLRVVRGRCGADQVGRVEAAACAVAEHERSGRFVDSAKVGARDAVRSLELEDLPTIVGPGGPS
jgi:hypothetical protein